MRKRVKSRVSAKKTEREDTQSIDSHSEGSDPPTSQNTSQLTEQTTDLGNTYNI